MPYIQDFDIADIPPPVTLLQVRIGKVQSLSGTPIKSAINKQPLREKVTLTATGLVGDHQVFELHGGPDKALHQYDANHYSKWNEEQPDLVHLFQQGGFGENISTAGMNEKNVCIGDQYSIGEEVIVEISEPRQPCFKLNHRFKWKKASITAQNTGRTGWYLRVLRAGEIQQGDTMALIKRPYPRWSLSRIQEIMYRDVTNSDAMKELIELAVLGVYIRNIFHKRLLEGPENMTFRLKGPSEQSRVSPNWRPYRLVMKENLTPRIKKFVLELADKDHPVPRDHELGSFPHVRVKFGGYTRAYSVVKGNLGNFELGISRDDNSRGGSQYFHDQIQIGDILEVVKGHATILNHDRDRNPKTKVQRHVFIIGGIGITAFLQQIKRLEKTGEVCEIHYAVRSRKEAAYLDHLSSCCTTKLTVYFKDEKQRLDIPAIVTPLMEDALITTAIYTCGPPSLMDAVRSLALSQNFPPSLLHFEDFGSGTISNSGPLFTAKIKSSGKVLDVPSGKSLLKVLKESGMDVQSSCEAGNCGACMIDYCGGKVEHRGVALMEEEKGESLLSCVSRGKEGECVVLDL